MRLAHRRARVRAFTRTSAGPPSRWFSQHALRPHPEPGPFSGPPARRVSVMAGCFGLGCPPAVCLATRRGAHPAMRTTDVCFPLHLQRVPALRELPVSLRGCRLALDRQACTYSHETGGRALSRCPIRFGETSEVCARRISSARPQVGYTPDAPVAPKPTPRAVARRRRLRVPRPHSTHASVTRHRHCNPRRLPSTGDIRTHARTAADLRSSHVRLSAPIQPHGAFSPAAPRLVLSHQTQ